MSELDMCGRQGSGVGWGVGVAVYFICKTYRYQLVLCAVSEVVCARSVTVICTLHNNSQQHSTLIVNPKTRPVTTAPY